MDSAEKTLKPVADTPQRQAVAEHSAVAAGIYNSPRMVAQRQQLRRIFSATAVVQREDDVLAGQDDWGDLVDGVAEVTEGIEAMDLGEDEPLESADESEVAAPLGNQPLGAQPQAFGIQPPPWGQPVFGQPPPFGQPIAPDGPGLATPLASPFGAQPSPWDPPVFGRPSPFSPSIAPAQPLAPNLPLFGSGGTQGSLTFASVAQEGKPWAQFKRDPAATGLPLAVAYARARASPVVQRIGANKVKSYTAANGTTYKFKTTQGGFVDFDNPAGLGYGPALAVVADVNIMDPAHNTKLEVPPGWKKKNWIQNPPLKNKRGMHFLAANWVHNKTVSQASPGTDTWHHHKDKGRMQLIDAEVHGNIPHNGGHSTWGKK